VLGVELGYCSAVILQLAWEERREESHGLLYFGRE